MIKNKIAQLIFEIVYCVLAIIGFLLSLGLFNAKLNYDFYVYYTNISNYICMVFMFAILIKNIISLNKMKNGLLKYGHKFNFMCVIIIIITCLVYNFLIANGNLVREYFSSLSSLLMHLILPIMFVLHWVLFYQHGMVRWYFPLYATIIPLVYVGFIFIRALILGSDSRFILYPYFFLNVENIGWSGVFLWILLLWLFFVAVGYILFLLDNIKIVKKNNDTNNK